MQRGDSTLPWSDPKSAQPQCIHAKGFQVNRNEHPHRWSSRQLWLPDHTYKSHSECCLTFGLQHSDLMNGVVCILLHRKRTYNARGIYFFFLISSSDNPNFVGRTTSPPSSVLEVWVGLPPLLGVKGKHVTQGNVAFLLLLTKPML